MSLIDFTLKGDEPLEANGTAASSVPDFFMWFWYSQWGMCSDSAAIRYLQRLDEERPLAQVEPSLEQGPGSDPRPRRTNSTPSLDRDHALHAVGGVDPAVVGVLPRAQEHPV